MVLAALLLVGVLLLLVAAPGRLAVAAWPLRAPGPALLLWQAIGLTGGLLALEVCALLALAPYGDDVVDAVSSLEARGPWDEPVSWVAATVGLLVFVRLLSVLVRSTSRTMTARRRHRVMVDLLATRNPLLADTRVVDHDLPVAYCLPGLRPRVVVSRGVVAILEEQELRAVLAHERAHLGQRHDLVVLPFVALSATFPWLPAVRHARAEVLLLVEVLADDRAARRHDRTALARALWKVGESQVPSGGFGIAGSGGSERPAEVVVRVNRLLHPPAGLSSPAVVAVFAAALAVGLLPAVGLVLPLLLPS
jgi:Zn-dependent protease with chaperone function